MSSPVHSVLILDRFIQPIFHCKCLIICHTHRLILFKASALWADAFYKSICPSVRLYVCPSVRLSVCTSVRLFTFEVPFNGLFAPTSRSRMSNIFRDSESLVKSNGKKWSQIWTFLFRNCLKSPRTKKFFSLLFSVFFGFRSFLMVFLPPLPEIGCPIFLEIRNSWGKVLERSGLRYEHFCLKIFENRRAKKSFFSSLFHFWGTV